MNELCNVCHRLETEHRQNLFCCPLCGGQAQFESYTTSIQTNLGPVSTSSYRLWCTCFDCKMQVIGPNAATVIERWNRRATTAWIEWKDRAPDFTLPIFLEVDWKIIALERGFQHADEVLGESEVLLLRRNPELFRWFPIPGRRRGDR